MSDQYTYAIALEKLGLSHSQWQAMLADDVGTDWQAIDERIFDSSLDGVGPSDDEIENPDRVGRGDYA
jgi:hypothetical protein